MKGLIQRVSQAQVSISGEIAGEIGQGLLLFLGVEPDDSEATAKRLLERVLTYRVFPDETGRMNRSLLDTGGQLLVVPQFTLAADTRRGTRPGFSTAAPPAKGEELFLRFVEHAATRLPGDRLAKGRFGADMKVLLENDGPVTFLLAS